jgi:16S rRNA (guanine966-N2)-methyltransferase
MRIVSGRLGGRRLRAPDGAATRPTSERVREALFSILGPPAPDTDVLDLFAGSGALGLEALSRGARSVTFVDSGRPALDSLRANIAEVGAGAAATVVAQDVLSFLRRGWAARWVFVDPPYRSDLATRTLDLLGESPSEDTLVIVEHDRRNVPLDRHGSLIRTDSRRYGDTVLAFYRKPEGPT